MSVTPITAELAINDLVGVWAVKDMIEDALQDLAYPENDIIRINIAVEEAVVNAIKHGNQMDPDKRVLVVFSTTPERFDIRITDEGPGFDPEEVDDPPGVHILRRAFGRGLLLMRTFMTEVKHHGRGNVVTMTKMREAAQEPKADQHTGVAQ